MPDDGEEIIQRLIDVTHDYFKNIAQEQLRRQKQDNTTDIDSKEDVVCNSDVFLSE